MTPPIFDIPSKPTLIKLTQDIDFFELFEHIESKYDTCFLFESLGDDSHIARFHLIGFDPIKTITAPNRHTLAITDNINKQTQHYPCDNPYHLLQQITPQHVITSRHVGGLVGYLGYDCINFFEPSLDVKPSDDFEPFKFGLYLDGLSLDKMTGEIFYFYYHQNRIDDIKALLQLPKQHRKAPSVRFIKDSATKEEHATSVQQVKEHIKSGRIFQCEVGFKSHYQICGDCLPIYEQLRMINPSPHMYFVKFGHQKIIGASPELLFRLHNGEMQTHPLAGTTKRGTTDNEDKKLARQLLNDPKEIAEHSMLVDLHRNDIGRVAQFGSVKVRNLMDIKRFSHVQHIYSEIVGILHPDHDMFSALASNFPAGTLTGAPKIEAIKIINDIESDGRGVYGGAVGQFLFNGDCIFAIAIRSLFVCNQKAYVQTCGGNVFDSNADDEYEEIIRKLSAMKAVLDYYT